MVMADRLKHFLRKVPLLQEASAQGCVIEAEARFFTVDKAAAGSCGRP